MRGVLAAGVADGPAILVDAIQPTQGARDE